MPEARGCGRFATRTAWTSATEGAFDTVRARQESIFETVRRGAEAGDRQCAAAWAPSGGLRLVSFTNEPGSMLQVLRDRGRSRGA
jgi:hypothetical protein